MWIYGIFLLIMPFACRAMEPSPSAMEIDLPEHVMLKDANKKHIATLNPQEYEILKKLNPILRIRPKDPKEGGLIVPYGIVTGLNEEQIKSLAQSLKSQNNFYQAIAQGLININNITPEQLKEINEQLENIGLKPLDDILVIRTADHQWFAVEKHIVTHFFKTIEESIRDFPNNIAIDISLRGAILFLLYELVRDIGVTPREQWEKIENFLQTKKYKVGVVKELLTALEFLNVNNVYILGPFIEYYKSLLNQQVWDDLKQKSPFLRQYADISNNLKTLKKIAVKQVDNVWIGIIQGAGFNSLKGIEIIKDIDKCEMLFIVNTDIDKIETDSLGSLPNLTKLAFITNKKLTKLEKNCLKNPILDWLLFYQNNITELPAEVFDLPHLTNLLFARNNLQVIKANWGINVPQLTNFYLIETTVKAFEPGWLNGLASMTLFFYRESYYLNDFLEILKKGFLPGQKLSIDKLDDQKILVFYQLMDTRTTEPHIFVKGLFLPTSFAKTISG